MTTKLEAENKVKELEMQLEHYKGLVEKETILSKWLSGIKTFFKKEIGYELQENS